MAGLFEGTRCVRHRRWLRHRRSVRRSSGSSRRTEGKLEEAVREIVEAGGSAQGVKCDVTVESMVRSAVESVAGDEGQHDVAVNRVGPARRAVSCAPLSLFEFGDTADSWQV
jgi:NAD(P)-dependent dehydrogenase (short-subunit alcohol dehydrogenase family)